MESYRTDLHICTHLCLKIYLLRMRGLLEGGFRVSPRCETPSYKYYLIMIKHSFCPKMRRKNFENRFTNKNLMSKNAFE